MLRVMRNHRRAAHGENTGYEKLATAPVRLDHLTLASHEQNFGINARVLTGGRVEAGEAVEIIRPSASGPSGR